MAALRIGIQLKSLRMPLKRALLTAAQLGADAVEIDARHQLTPTEMSRSAVRHVRKLLEDLNLKVSAIGFRTHRGYNITQDLDARVEATKRAMSMAFELGAAVVINQVGPIPSEEDDPDWALLVEVLTDLGHFGERIGANLAAETGTESGVDMARLFSELPPGSVRVNLDPGNLIINSFSPAEAVTALGADIAHVHAKDGVRDLAQGRGVEVPLGRGTADWPALIGALQEHDFRGYFTVERENTADPVGEIGQAVQFLRNL